MGKLRARHDYRSQLTQTIPLMTLAEQAPSPPTHTSQQRHTEMTLAASAGQFAFLLFKRITERIPRKASCLLEPFPERLEEAGKKSHVRI